MADQCPVCGCAEVEDLPPPHPFQSVTSAGTLLREPLRKTQCPSCGVGRQRASNALGSKIEFYRHQYAPYHQRPGTITSELARYNAMASWILAELGEFKPSSILDIGCSAGFLLDALGKARPGMDCAGIEPSLENSKLARTRGLTVVTGTLPGAENLFEKKADVVLTANVISHIVDPQAFLVAMTATIVPEGRIVVYGHNGDAAGADLIWADVEFSYCREHLITLAAKVGLEHVNPLMGAPPPGQEDKYVLVFRRSEEAPIRDASLSDAVRESLLESRRAYFGAWRQLAARLNRLDYSRPIFNFGASFWSMALAAYCPEYWRGIEACVVDHGEGCFFGKPIVSTDSILGAAGRRPLIALGTNPATQPALARRLSVHADVIVWHDLIMR